MTAPKEYKDGVQPLEPWQRLATTSKYSPTLALRLTAALREGNSRTAACHMAGIAYPTFKKWLARGEVGEQPYAEFVQEVLRAQSEAEAEAVQKIRAGVQGWQGAAWFLERHLFTRERWRKPADRLEADVLGQLAKLLGDDDRAEEWLLARLEEVRARKAEKAELAAQVAVQ